MYQEGVAQFSLLVDREKKSVSISKWLVLGCGRGCGLVTVMFFSSLTMAPGPVLCLHGNPDTGTVVMQLLSGEVMKVMPTSPESTDGCGLSPWLLDSGSPLRYKEQIHCDRMELAVFNGKVQSGCGHVTVM